MKSVLAAGVLAAMAFAVPASAATIQVVSGDGQRSFALGAFGSPVGQSFTAIDTNLTSFGFQFKQYTASGNLAAPNLSYTWTLLNGAGLTGSAIASRTFTVPTTTSATTPTWIDFDITGTNVIAGQVYTAILTSQNMKFGLVMGPNINLSNGQELSGDAYTGGRAYFTQEVYANCARTGNCDLNFRVTGTTAAGAVPEPATWAMMLAGFGALGFALRRRPRQAARIRFA